MAKISFCIPTIGRASQLEKLVDSIVNSAGIANMTDYEILIGNGGQIEDVSEKVRKNQNVRVIVSNRGDASSGRNIAADVSTSGYLVFLDDDVWLDASYFTNLEIALNLLEKSSGIVGIVGNVTRFRNGTPIDSAWLDAGFDRYFELPKKAEKLRWGCTANLIVKKDAFYKAGKFKDTPIPVGGEDIEFGMRLTKNGFFLGMPSLQAYHGPITSAEIKGVLQKAYYYGRSEQWLDTEFPGYSKVDAQRYLRFIFNASRYALSKNTKAGIRMAFDLGGIVQSTFQGSIITSVSASKMAKDVANNVNFELDDFKKYWSKNMLMVIKPAGMPYKKEIIERITKSGFDITSSKTVILKEEDIEFMYGQIFENIKYAYLDKADEMIANHKKYLQSGKVMILSAAYIGDNGFEAALKLRGEKIRGEECTPGSIRFDFPGKGVFNSFHSSADIWEAASQTNYFFRKT